MRILPRVKISGKRAIQRLGFPGFDMFFLNPVDRERTILLDIVDGRVIEYMFQSSATEFGAIPVDRYLVVSEH